MGVSVYDYQSSEASSSTTGGWNTAENQDPSTVNDGMRAHKQNVANFLKDFGGTGQTVGGTANAITLTTAQPISALSNGMRFTFVPALTNTSSTVTINPNSIGAKSVKKRDLNGIYRDIDVGDIATFRRAEIVYGSTLDIFLLLNPAAERHYSTGHLWGLTLSNNGSDATNDIDIAVGTARDGADSANIDLTSAITKRLDASWAVGTGNGGLDTGSIANTTYHVWLIKRSDTGVVDVLFSTSASSPTMPSNYDLKRRIGSIVRTGGAIKAFVQNGDEFLWVTPVLDVSANAPGTSAVTRTLTIPTGIVIDSIFDFSIQNADGATAAHVWFSPLSVTDGTPSSTAAPLLHGIVRNAAATTLIFPGRLSIRTNTSAQVRSRVSGLGDANVTLYMSTVGWNDARGRI